MTPVSVKSKYFGNVHAFGMNVLRSRLPVTRKLTVAPRSRTAGGLHYTSRAVVGWWRAESENGLVAPSGLSFPTA